MPVKLLSKKEEAPGAKTFSFSKPAGYSFKPGQFAFLNFGFQGKQFEKHFTISNSPTRKNIEFTTIISDSDYKRALDALQPGAAAEISGAMGEFTLDSRKGDKIAFLVGGIGITPVRSILQFLAGTQPMKQLEIVVFYSNRNEQRIAFREELDGLNAKIPKLKIVHTLTDLGGEEKKRWKGETGFISAEMVKKHLQNPEQFIFFVVGPPAFNGAMEKMLRKELKISGKMIVTETFSGY